MNTILSCLRHLDVTENLIMQYCVRNAIPLLTNQKRMQGAFIRCSGLHAGTEVFFFCLCRKAFTEIWHGGCSIFSSADGKKIYFFAV